MDLTDHRGGVINVESEEREKLTSPSVRVELEKLAGASGGEEAKHGECRQLSPPSGGSAPAKSRRNREASLRRKRRRNREASQPGMSKPDELLIFHAEGKISKGPDGAEVSPSCPFVVRRLAELNTLPFQQVYRVIMGMFNLNEATHELTLQHIVYVVINPSTPPYRVLIDIVGQDSWAAFLDVGLRTRGFRLYARWSVKKTTSVSGGTNICNTTVPVKDPTVTDDSDDGSWPACKHDKPCTIEASKDSEDPGRRFYRCPFYTPGEDCKFTQWLDKKFPKKANEVINKLQGNVEALQRHVDNLKYEVEELRRRLRKRSTKEASVSHAERCSCGKSPCDLACRNKDDQKRPTQIPKLARDN